MAKILLLLVIAIIAIITQECAALKCYTCNEACEVSKATEGTCGDHIGPSQEAVCTTEVPKGKEKSTEAIRKCQITNKNQPIGCNENSVCTSCKTELCNTSAASSIAGNLAIVGIVAAYFVTKFVFH